MLSYDVCECGAPLQRMERPTPKPKGTEVLLEVLAAGVCHSDLHIWDGYYDIGGGKVLQALRSRHQAAADDGPRECRRGRRGRPDAKGVKVGDVRLAHPWMGCGECKVCQRGDENLCLKSAQSRRLIATAATRRT